MLQLRVAEVFDSRDPEISVAVSRATICSEKIAREWGEVRFDEARVIAEQRSQHAGPRLAYAEYAAGRLARCVFDARTGPRIEKYRFDAEEGQRRAAGLHRRGEGQRCNQMTARFSLPVSDCNKKECKAIEE